MFKRIFEQYIPPHLAATISPQAEGAHDVFNKIMTVHGEVFRDVPGRRTIKVMLGDKSYFIKQHFGVGWKEIFKNLLTLRLPILSAVTEWQAIQKLREIGIPTTLGAAYGVRGNDPASLQSYLITEDLGDIISLETLCASWRQNPPDPRFKRRLILEVARIAGALHANGMNHRDFYICHFCLDQSRLKADEIYLYLIDLHRVGIKATISATSQMKDIAALYFSAMDAGLTSRDYLRFLCAYRRLTADNTPKLDEVFWRRVTRRANQLYIKYHGNIPVT